MSVRLRSRAVFSFVLVVAVEGGDDAAERKICGLASGKATYTTFAPASDGEVAYGVSRSMTLNSSSGSPGGRSRL